MVYMGGKARLAKIYLPIILKDRNNRKYYEPFAGGMNMIANVDGNRYANDNNKYLIAMWKKYVMVGFQMKFQKTNITM